MPSERIEDAIRRVRQTTSSATDERIITSGEAAMAKRNTQHPAAMRSAGESWWALIQRSHWTRLATATVAIAAIILGMHTLTGSGTSITMAQVRQAMQGIDWVQMVEKNGPVVAWYSFASKVQILVDDKGKIIYFDFNTGKELVWSPGSEVIYESPIDEGRQFAGGVTNIFEALTKQFDSWEAEGKFRVTRELGTYQGQRVETWKASPVKKEGGSTPMHTLTVHIDVQTKLLVAVMDEVKELDGNVRIQGHGEFTYPETGPANIYEAGAPKSAKIVPAPEK
jgi:hypothetical protein